MNQDEKKIKVAEAALEHIETGQIVGIGSGTTVHALIEKIDKVKNAQLKNSLNNFLKAFNEKNE